MKSKLKIISRNVWFLAVLIICILVFQGINLANEIIPDGNKLDKIQLVAEPQVCNMMTSSGLLASLSNVELDFDPVEKTSEPANGAIASDEVLYVYTSKPVRVIIVQQ